MYIVGELINGMYKKVAAAISARDEAVIVDLATRQMEAGADALDINCGPLSKDPAADMIWLVETARKACGLTLSLDSTKFDVIEAGLKVSGAGAIINSTTADPEKLDIYLDLANQYQASLIALAVDKKGIPQDKDRRLELAASIVTAAQSKGFPAERLYLDPILVPINVAQNQLFGILEAIKDFKILTDPSPKTIVGLSNISQGSKNRSLVNRVFLSMAQGYGLDAAILDPTDELLTDTLITGELVLNRDIYCNDFITAHKKSKRQ